MIADAVALPGGDVRGTVLLVLGLLLLSAFLSGTETALFSLREIDRRRIAERRTPEHRRIHGLFERRPALTTTLLVGSVLATVAGAAASAALVAALAPGVPWLTVVLVTPALVLVAELTPKILAFRYSRSWVDRAVWPVIALHWLLAPVRVVVSGVVSALARLFGVTDATLERPLRQEEFLALVGRGAEQGVVAEEEREIIEAVFELEDLPVVRLMTPKPHVFSLPIDVPWSDLLAACQRDDFSRVPIWEGSPDNVIGVLLVKDLLRHRRRPLASPDELRRLLLPPVFVPATKHAHDLMKEMIRRRIHMVFVVDEHGTMMGLVSLDDLLIELVGELGEADEADEPEDVVHADDLTLTVRAAVDLEDFAEQTGIRVPEGDYHTLGGFVFHTLGRVPVEGDAVAGGGHRFEVVEMDGRRVNLVRVLPEDQGVPA